MKRHGGSPSKRRKSTRKSVCGFGKGHALINVVRDGGEKEGAFIKKRKKAVRDMTVRRPPTEKKVIFHTHARRRRPQSAKVVMGKVRKKTRAHLG